MTNWLDSLSISASGLTAQRLRMDVIANNIANANSTRTPTGGPYRSESVVLSPSYAPVSFSNWLALAENGVQATSSPLTPTGLPNSTAAGVIGTGVNVVGIASDTSPFKLVYDPSSPDAVHGYVEESNVDIATQMTDMVSASAAYQADVTAFDAGKQMDVDALALGK